MNETIIDDKAIAKPPYSGPSDKPLPEQKVSDKAMKAILSDLFVDKESAKKKLKDTKNK